MGGRATDWWRVQVSDECVWSEWLCVSEFLNVDWLNEYVWVRERERAWLPGFLHNLFICTFWCREHRWAPSVRSVKAAFRLKSDRMHGQACRHFAWSEGTRTEQKRWTKETWVNQRRPQTTCRDLRTHADQRAFGWQLAQSEDIRANQRALMMTQQSLEDGRWVTRRYLGWSEDTQAEQRTPELTTGTLKWHWGRWEERLCWGEAHLGSSSVPQWWH